MYCRHSLSKCIHSCTAKSTTIAGANNGSSLSRWIFGSSQFQANPYSAIDTFFTAHRRTLSSSSSSILDETLEDDLVVDPSQQRSSSSAFHDRPTTNAKSGSSSPWAVYDDVWGSSTAPPSASSSTAGTVITSSITPEQMLLLGPESVKIDDSTEMGSETKILEAYNSHLESRSSSHFGYPYNLDVRAGLSFLTRVRSC
jgi:hypothetical protein